MLSSSPSSYIFENLLEIFMSKSALSVLLVTAILMTDLQSQKFESRNIIN
jgi:hypothetical protein